MPINLDTYPHTQLRYTVRLGYKCPIYNEHISNYLFMTDEEYNDSATYHRIIDAKMEELNTLLYDGENKIEDWENVEEIKNSFSESEILSDAVIDVLKDDNATDDEIKLALLYLYSIHEQYSKARVKKEIDRLSFNPLKNIVDRILSIWNTSSRAKIQMNGTVKTKWSKQDQELSQLLSERYKDAISTFRKDLCMLNNEWGVRTEKDKYRRAVIIAKFLCDYPGTKGLYVGFSEGMRILYDYFQIPHTTYKKRVLIPTSDVMETLSKGQRAFQEQIKEPWAEFISRF